MDEQKQEQTPEQAIEKAAAAAKSAATAGKAAKKAATGNVAGALWDVATDPRIVKAVISVILVFALLITMVLSFVGSAITGAIVTLVDLWEKNYDEAWVERGIASNGSALYMFSFDGLDVTFQAIGGTIMDVFDPTNGSFVDGKDASNSSLEGGDVFEQEDVKQTLEALKDADAMNGAIKRRLDMIKGRVKQRGIQIQNNAATQYGFESLGNLIAVILMHNFENPFLFEGIAWDQCSVNVDTSAFDLTDTQALKILCAYSVQYDADLSSVDMWSLMHYCGWYDYEMTTLPAAHLENNSIYSGGSMNAIMGGGLDGVISAGTNITGELSSSTYFYNPLTVPYWRGTFVPQWVVEQRAQIQEHNDHYWDLLEQGREIGPEDQLWGTQASRDSEITGFEKLDAVEPYGIIDKLFYTSTAQMTVTPVNIHQVTSIPQEILANLWEELREAWLAIFGGEKPDPSYSDGYGNYIRPRSIRYLRSYYNGQSYNCRSGDKFKIGRNGSAVTASGNTIYFGGLSPNSTYTIYKYKHVYQGAYQWLPVLTFTTPGDPKDPEAEAYQLEIDINIAFSAASVDQMINSTIGLWSGDLRDVVETATGTYQKGKQGNELLLYQWEDTYKDASGQSHTVTFTRQHGYQAQAYSDSIMALGKEVLSEEEYNRLSQLHYSQGGAFNSGIGGLGIVAVAQAEYDLPDEETAGGGKYWNARCDYYGTAHSHGGAWCVCFVYYCAYKAGYLSADGCFGTADGGTGAWATYCSQSWNYFADQGRTYTSPEYRPEAGDLIYYTTPGNNFTHIGIVEKVDENGVCHTIEGNWSGNVNKRPGTKFPSFQYPAGSPAGGGWIVGYAKPDYPVATVQDSQDMLYESVAGELKPSVFAKEVGPKDNPIFIAGIARFDEEQARDFASKLSEKDAEFAAKPEVAALIEAAQTGDKNTLIEKWNAVAMTDAEEFQTMQKEYALKEILSPIYVEIRQNTGFNWGKTYTRLDILWAVATAVPEQTAAVQLLTKLCAGMNDSVSNYDLVTAYAEKIELLINQNKKVLWSGMDDETADLWAKTMIDLIPSLQSAYPQKGEVDFTTGTVQEQVFSYLVNSMDLTPAAACGVLANMEKESSFDPHALGDYGTSYGLCQWHDSRWTALQNFCNSRGLDWHTVQGQMEYLNYELSETYYSFVGDYLRQQPNTPEGAYNAAYYWCVKFEVPVNKEQNGHLRAGIAVDKYWPQFQNWQP